MKKEFLQIEEMLKNRLKNYNENLIKTNDETYKLILIIAIQGVEANLAILSVLIKHLI